MILNHLSANFGEIMLNEDRKFADGVHDKNNFNLWQTKRFPVVPLHPPTSLQRDKVIHTQGPLERDKVIAAKGVG